MNIENQYLDLLNKVLKEGVIKKDRTTTGTKSLFGVHLEHDMSLGFPLLTTKKVFLRGIFEELMWFLRGETNIQSLVKKDVNIWIDQIQNLIQKLKENPDSRRLMINSWNVSDFKNMILPPCHYSFQVWTRELTIEERIKILINQYDYKNLIKVFYDRHGRLIKKSSEILDSYNIPKRCISLMWQQRSVDLPLGLPFDIASYAMLLQILAHEVNMVPDKLKCTIGDAHIYLNQIKGVKEQLKRKPNSLPYLEFNKKESIFDYEWSDFNLKDYKPYPVIKFSLSN